MQVTPEDGGLLNAFTKEPRMEVMDQNASRDRNRSSLMTVIGGSILVTGLIAITVVIS
jgi:hypothetical protein